MNHQLTDTKALTALEPAGPLPDWLTRLNVPDDQIRDLTWTGRTDQGYWPVTVTAPVFDPATEILTDLYGSYTVDGEAKVWRAVLAKRALTPEELAAAQSDLYAYASNARYEREVGGTVVSGMAVATDDRSKLLLAGARIKAEADPTYTTRWKVSNTERVDIPAAQIVAMSDAVLAWVDRTFDAYDKVADRIAAGTVRTPAEIDAAFAVELA